MIHRDRIFLFELSRSGYTVRSDSGTPTLKMQKRRFWPTTDQKINDEIWC